jgi:hypothetical protein
MIFARVVTGLKVSKLGMKAFKTIWPKLQHFTLQLGVHLSTPDVKD